MSFAATALISVINEEFDGRKKNLADAAGLQPTVISKLIHRQNFGRETLSRICSVLSDKSAEKLCRAVCRDFLPRKFGDLNIDQVDPAAPFPLLDDKTRSIIYKIAAKAEGDAGTREWLRQMATWMFPK